LLKLSISFAILGQAQVAWPTSMPESGLIQRFESLLKTNTANLKQKKSDKKQIIPASAKIELTAAQLEEIIFFSPNNQLDLYLNNNCSLYTFMSKNVLYIKNRPLEFVEVNLIEKDKKTKATIPLNLFLENYYKKNCKLSFKQKDFFEVGRLKKTLTKLTPKLPVNKTQCQNQWKSWRNNINTEHICAITTQIENANKAEAYLNSNPSLNLSERSQVNSLRRERNRYLKEFNELQRSYFTNLCKNYDNEEKFCQSYSKQDYWTKITNFEKPQYKVAWKCKQILKKEKLSKAQLNSCIRRIRKNSLLCTMAGARKNSVIYPMPECSEISDALSASRLNNDYHDCPSKIGNAGVVNIFRILSHFKKGKATQNPVGCIFPSYAAIYELYLASKEEAKWPLQICYKDILTKKEKCSPFVPGNHVSDPYAQNNVVSDILFKSKIETTRPKCKVISKDEFNPKRLTYKTGCWVVPQFKECQEYNCPQIAVVDNKEGLKLYTKGDLSFNYFKNLYNSKIPTLNKRIIEEYGLKVRPISSLTSARFFLDSKKNGIIHGIGCAEDLNPIAFKYKGLGNCTPLPFIVDGHITQNNKVNFIFRSALDDVHSPRIIQWARIFSAISRYAEQHPLKTWNLHGLY
jgi:hypothetical protein